MRILVLEPYYGGSHKAFVDDLIRELPFAFELLALPARKWKWRMRLSAPLFADRIRQLERQGTFHGYDAILCSTFVDVAALRGLTTSSSGIHRLPILTYYHENQFVYPVQVDDQRDFHFALTNFTTALASSRLAFNSAYNRDTFLAGCGQILKKAPDMRFDDSIERIRQKSEVLMPGIDFTAIDAIAAPPQSSKPSVIVWNHRWEHDKNPELFFTTLYELDRQQRDFQLIVLGESFQRQPAIFEEARQRLARRILHFGYVPSRRQYIELLKQADVVVSTALHEFYGIAVLEAVRAGCRPLLPARLSYPELFSQEFLYEGDNLLEPLCGALEKGRLSEGEAHALTEPFSWEALHDQYKEWFLHASGA